MNIPSLAAIVAAVVTMSLGAETLPCHEWCFEAKNEKGVCLDTGSAKQKFSFYGKTATLRGVGFSTALVADGKDRNQLPHSSIDYPVFTVEFKFRPAELPAAKKRAVLLDYHFWSWGRNRWAVALDGDGTFSFEARKKDEIDFRAVSDVVRLRTGVYHTLRFQVDEKGVLTAWLDGAEIVRKEGAPGFDKLIRRPSDKYYPLLRLGFDDRDPAKMNNPFIGDFDELRIYDSALGAPKIELPKHDYSKIAKVEYKAADAEGADMLLLDERGHALSRRFRVLDHEGAALGLMEAADRKFVDSAAMVDLTVGAETIVARFICPVPDGMKAEKNDRNAWAGDSVELFIRPDLAKTAYFQYSANLAGKSNFMRCSAPDVVENGFVSAATVEAKDEIKSATPSSGFEIVFTVPVKEVFPAGLKAGDVFGVNFVRCGKTCSGASTWSAVGGKFNNIEGFGRAVYGGCAAYFARRAAALEKSVAGFRGEARTAAEGACKAVFEAVKTHGGDGAAFTALETMLANADKTLLQIRLAGMPLVIYEPKDAWGSVLAPDSAIRPLETIKMKLPRNGRAVRAFALANLRGHAYLGQFKCCSELPAKRFANVPQAGIARHAKFYRGFPIWNRTGKELYDPVEPLSMKTLVRLAPKEYSPVYLELDARGLEAGTYNALVYLKKATPGYEDLKVELEVEVTDLDVSTVKLDKAGYDYAGRNFAREDGREGGLLALLHERDYNVVLVNAAAFRPQADKDGVFKMGPFEQIDRQIDGSIANGYDRKHIKLWIYTISDRHWYDPVDHRGRNFPFPGEKWAEGIRFMIRGFKEHVKAKYGIGPDRIWWYTVDEPSGPIEDPTWKSSIAIAYRVAQEIKRESAENLTMTDPLPNFLASKGIDVALRKLRECYDIIELYRPGITPKTKALMAELKFPQVWTYSITSKETPAVKYRRDYWENMRDGYREIATFWHMTESAGGDTFDSTDCSTPGRFDDYATIYCNYDVGAGILSRRQLQCDQGFWDMQVLAAVRAKYAGNAEKLAAVDAIVREAAEVGTIAAMDLAREKLLGL